MRNKWKIILYLPLVATYVYFLTQMGNSPESDVVFWGFVIGVNVTISSWLFVKWAEAPPKYWYENPFDSEE